ncbi:MAG: asparaginase [Erysipelotrichales bacterium]|nr:asparaginase [Erysipelotrichales bacterium]
MKSILLITTGGTIASSNNGQGLVPTSSSNEILNMINKIASEYDVSTMDLFSLDSSNIQMEEWQKMAETIYLEHKKYDGIVLTHGTDTMAYTGSVLSFMLQNVPIPIVLTGSQLPLHHPMTDGIENLRTAFAMAASEIPGVFIAFNRKVMLATRAVKVRTTSFDAFESVNADYIATVDSRGLVIHKELLPTIQGDFILRNDICSDVFLIKLIPGMNPNIFDALLSMNIKGVVIEAFGAGGVQYLRRDITNKLSKLVDNNISVVVCSQCLYERSDFSIYEVGQKVLAQGVIEGMDMTSEAAICKLMWGLAYYRSTQEIKELFNTNLVGEVHLI